MASRADISRRLEPFLPRRIVRDARGRRRTVEDRIPWNDPRLGDPAYGELAARLRRARSGIARGQTRAAGVFVIVLIAGVGAAVRADAAIIAAAIVAVLFLMYLADLGAARRQAAAAVVEHRAVGTCASCLYDLRGIRAGLGGCRVCPDRGAAWNLAKRNGEP